uniref:Uncharacterized protein n=1 Tax=Parascaris univalens TaxID=6257 RepID=A0A915ARD8_PARUN
MISGQGRSNQHCTLSKIKLANRCCYNVASAKGELEKFWSLELLGVKDSPSQTDDELAVKRFNEGITFEDGRYCYSWPWKEDGGKLDCNFGLFVGRLKTSLKRLQKEPELLRAYEKTFDEQLKTGIIEDVTNTQPEGPVYYMSHKAVVQPGKAATEIRIAYDASSKTLKEGHSLNGVLLRGPLLQTNLCGVLFRVRLAPILMTADVEKAFLQIGLRHDQRGAARFIWVKDVTAPVSSTNIRVFRFTRVRFGVISSPILLNGAIQYHLERKTTEFREEIQDNIYVDNVFLTAHQIPAAIEKGHEAKRVFNGSVDWKQVAELLKGQLKHTGPTFLWSDSQATLHWIATAAAVDRLVDNRLAEIRRSSAQFRCVDSGNNAADLATRGFTIAELRQCSQWWEGPSFLQQESRYRPEWTVPRNPIILVIIPSTPAVGDVLECERFSTLNKLKRTTGT